MPHDACIDHRAAFSFCFTLSRILMVNGHHFVTMYYFHPFRFARSSIAKQNLSHRVNDVCNGSPSRIRIVRRISLGITTLPRSSMRLTIPVAFISLVLRIFVVQSLFSAIEQKLCRKKICVFFISIPLQKLFRRRSLHLHRQRDHRHRRRLGI